MSNKTTFSREYIELLKTTSADSDGFYTWFEKNAQTYYLENKTPTVTTIRIKERQCFRNSLLIALEQGLEYCEGYYVVDGIPLALDHAFNLNDAGEVVDVTAQKFDIDVIEWHGIKIPPEILDEYVDSGAHTKLSLLRFYFLTMQAVNKV